MTFTSLANIFQGTWHTVLRQCVEWVDLLTDNDGTDYYRQHGFPDFVDLVHSLMPADSALTQDDVDGKNREIAYVLAGVRIVFAKVASGFPAAPPKSGLGGGATVENGVACEDLNEDCGAWSASGQCEVLSARSGRR